METPEARPAPSGHPAAEPRWLWTVATNTDEGPAVVVCTTEAEAALEAAIELGWDSIDHTAAEAPALTGFLASLLYRERGETRAYIDENGTAVSIQRHEVP